MGPAQDSDLTGLVKKLSKENQLKEWRRGIRGGRLARGGNTEW